MKISRTSLNTLFTGVFAGAVYLPLALQMMLASGFLSQISQSVTIYFFPLCWAALGLGFLAPPLGEGRFARWSAISLSVFLLAALFLPLQIDSNPRLVTRVFACLLPAGFWYFTLGRELNRQFGRASARVHASYGIFMAGVAAGTVLADRAVPLIGANAWMLVLIAAAPLARLKASILWIPIFAAALFFSNADLHIERLRNVGEYPPAAGNTIAKESRKFLMDYGKSFDRLAWNRRGQTFFYRDDEHHRYQGVINLEAEHYLPFDPTEGARRRFVHQHFKAGEKVLLIGAGSARSLGAIPKDALGKNIFALERDGNTVGLVADGINPLVSRINYLAGDGRAFAETSAGGWNWIYLESALDQQKSGPLQLFMPQNLFTKEAIGTYLDRLSEGGTLVIEVSRFPTPKRINTTRAIVEGIETYADRYQTLVFIDGEDGHLWAMARKGGTDLREVAGWMPKDYKEISPGRFGEASCLKDYGDSAPFLDWMCMSPSTKSRWSLTALGVLALFILMSEFGRAREASGSSLRFSFLFQSLGQTFIFLAVSYKLRSLFTDEISTFYAFNVATSLIAAGAAFTVQVMHDRKLRIPVSRLGSAMALSAALLLLILAVPAAFTGPLALRSLLFVVAVTPFYFFSSLLFNETLEAAMKVPNGVREAFLYDSIALVPAYAIMPWILFEWGTDALAAAALGAFALSLFVLQFSARPSHLEPVGFISPP